jgi:hypothetical protein
MASLLLQQHLTGRQGECCFVNHYKRKPCLLLLPEWFCYRRKKSKILIVFIRHPSLTKRRRQRNKLKVDFSCPFLSFYIHNGCCNDNFHCPHIYLLKPGNLLFLFMMLRKEGGESAIAAAFGRSRIGTEQAACRCRRPRKSPRREYEVCYNLFPVQFSSQSFLTVLFHSYLFLS